MCTGVEIYDGCELGFKMTAAGCAPCNTASTGAGTEVPIKGNQQGMFWQNAGNIFGSLLQGGAAVISSIKGNSQPGTVIYQTQAAPGSGEAAAGGNGGKTVLIVLVVAVVLGGFVFLVSKLTGKKSK